MAPVSSTMSPSPGLKAVSCRSTGERIGLELRSVHPATKPIGDRSLSETTGQRKTICVGSAGSPGLSEKGKSLTGLGGGADHLGVDRLFSGGVGQSPHEPGQC